MIANFTNAIVCFSPKQYWDEEMTDLSWGNKKCPLLNAISVHI